jgi:enterochelin esterase family protein
MRDLDGISDASVRAARASRFVSDVVAAGGTPLEDATSDRVVFLAQGAAPNGGPWSVAGSFTNWKTSAVVMKAIPGTDLAYLDTHLPRGQAYPYKLLGGTSDDGFRQDFLARSVTWDGINHVAPGEFNAIAHVTDRPANTGRIVAHRGVHATELGDARDVFVYIPPRADAACDPLPLLVVHDGNESLTRGDFVSVAEARYGAHPEEQSVIAFVALSSQEIRTDEYTFGTATAKGDAYGHFLANDLLPLLEKETPLCTAPDARGQTGASLGGLISVYLAFQRPDLWGYVGAQSASLFWDNNAMVTRAGADPKVPVRFYLDSGCPDDNCDVVRSTSDALKTKGYDVTHVEVPNAQHDWPYWRARWDGMLAAFRAGKTTCN